ncbi:hypothetical protein PAXINDRAFT_9350 [Paxillus involutus ATCC 200175]|nr:hypothetical protein PAXINDRAFT_9350 [Paxillus involutus ATCC 200175]
MSDMQIKAQRLKEVSHKLINEAEATVSATQDTAETSDEELFSLYEDLMQLDPVLAPSLQSDVNLKELGRRQLESDKLSIAAVEERLVSALIAAPVGAREGGLAERLSGLRGGEVVVAPRNADAVQQHARIVELLEIALDRMEAALVSVGEAEFKDEAVPKNAPARVHVGILSKDEWMSLVRICIDQRDTSAAEQAVCLMQRAGFHVPDESIDAVLADHAKRGETRRFESFMARILSGPPTENQRDLHVKAHIAKTALPSNISGHSFSSTQQFPTGALAVLHQYEAAGHFAPMRSYTRAISALFNVQTSPSSNAGLGRAAAQGQAWDLFAHMRYVAHPTPDAHLYALMIRACGPSTRPEPERALDLWTEMQESGVAPTKGAYEAIIRVCGRAGKEWVGEGMRLAREMGDRYSITGTSGRGLWCALLEGCKRAGDLNKARWILAEAVRGGDKAAEEDTAVVDAELMMHVFHTYASYRPPFRRDATRLVDGNTQSNGEAFATQVVQTDKMPGLGDSPSHTDTGQTQADEVLTNARMDNVPSFSRLPPQTPSDVIAEARALFDRIVRDRNLSPGGFQSFTSDSTLAGRFSRIELTPALLNAYLSVFYRHASVETSQGVFNSLFGRNFSSAQSSFQADEHIYISALERCTLARAEDRRVAARWAQDVWQRWQATEAEGVRNGKATVGSFARSIERAHAAMRRVLLLSGDIDAALTLLRTFVSQYPPTALLQPPTQLQPRSSLSPSAPQMTSPVSTPKSPTITLFAKPPILSTRTVLANPIPSTPSSSTTSRPLIRLTSAVGPKDDRVPPLIGFNDVDLLHARLAEHGRARDLGYIKWVCKAYASALKKRRDAVLKAAPVLQGDPEVD